LPVSAGNSDPVFGPVHHLNIEIWTRNKEPSVCPWVVPGGLVEFITKSPINFFIYCAKRAPEAAKSYEISQ
jgi:hypothetical protein